MAMLRHIVTPAGPIIVQMKPHEEAERMAEQIAQIMNPPPPPTPEEKLARLGLTKDDLKALLKE